ncbi:MAG TPA: AAA family ATPase [Verrucomicrobiae bacterium]|jgi:predicted ATPase
MLTHLEISNFRGIEKLKLDDLRPFSILVGKNGIGKTTVLEAASIVGYPDSLQNVLELGWKRDLPKFSWDIDVNPRSLFFRRRPDIPIKLSFQAGHGDELVEITGFEERPQASASRNETRQQLTRLEMVHTAGTTMTKNSVTLSDDPSRPSYWLEYGQRATSPNRLGCFTVTARSEFEGSKIAAIYANLLLDSRGESFLKILKTIRDDVYALNSFSFGDDSLLLVTTKDGAMPANLLGDGFCRVAMMAAALFNRNGSLAVVDEIDSGLHRSVMEKFWKESVTLQGQLGFQLICATHDEDMLLAALDAFENHQDSIAVYRLEQEKTGHPRPVRYSWEQLKYSVESGVDPRG